MWYDGSMNENKEKKKEQKRQARAEKRRARVERHAVPCPHCGKSVLDHMTVCPYCKGELQPLGYRYIDPHNDHALADPEKLRKIKLICSIVGGIVAVAIIVVIFVTR